MKISRTVLLALGLTGLVVATAGAAPAVLKQLFTWPGTYKTIDETGYRSLKGDLTVTAARRQTVLEIKPDIRYRVTFLPHGQAASLDLMAFHRTDTWPIQNLVTFREIDQNILTVFTDTELAVTADAGTTWHVWNAATDLDDPSGGALTLIESVDIDSDGKGVMTLVPLPFKPDNPDRLYSDDFGKSWSHNPL